MKKTQPRQVWKRETWKPYKVLVLRDQRGRFRHWARIRPKPPTKAPRRHFAKVTYEEHKVPSRWEGMKPTGERTYAGVKRGRRFEKPLKGRGVAIYDSEKRFEFYGTGKQLYQAIAKSKNRNRGKVPRGYVRVRAERYLDNPDKYEEEGDWSPFVKVESL
jgi:hypothetical protein